MSKLYYKGMALSKYCKNNGLKMQNVVYVVNKLLNDETTKDLDIEKIIDIAIKRITTNIVYKGLPIKEFCIENELDYSPIKELLNKFLMDDKYANVDSDTLVEMAIEVSPDNIKKYCYKHGIRYSKFKYRMEKLQKDEKYCNLSYEEKMRAAIKGFENEDARVLYRYKGVALTTYCKEHKLNYKTIKYRIERILVKDEFKDLPIEKVIEMAINNEVVFETKVVNHHSTKYFYNGVSLARYCEDNNLNYYSLIKRIIRIKNKKIKISIEKIIDYVVKEYHPWYNEEYFYKGIELSEYCKSKNLNYKYVLTKINRERRYSLENVDSLVNRIVSKYEIFRRKAKLDYSYKGVPFYEICKENRSDYNNLRQKVNRMYFSEEYANYSLEQIIEMVIDKNNKYKKVQRIRDLQLKMKKKMLTDSEVIEACNLLNIDYESVMALSKKMLVNKAINLIWCYFDIRVKDNRKSISDEKIEDVLKLVEIIKKNDKKEIDKIEIRDLVKMYKIGLIDTRDILVKRFSVLISGSVFSAATYYNVWLNNELREEFEAQATLYFFESLDNVTDVKYNGRIVNYIYKRVRGYIKWYVKDYKEQYHMKRLEDESRYTGLTLMEILPSKNNEVKDNKKIDVNKYFSLLNKAEIKFMMLIYNENYTYEELSKLYNVDIEKIMSKEKELLNRIKKEDIQLRQLLKSVKSK